ncbi:peptidoglycan bridge formation glycyltransferase FemY [Kribbella albertanoniae]|uniref:Peptidoglycan bridge formation glycyltransferase FemA/FemB family protein n=2 Tax=Kribbella albertanoniae TaxID=1266829 RepID=A0A4R4QH76_9ACTN|nr:peptidoglycan bridge formation glycyltransferase FemA/FemB family protein [Kribbella albertanoniae]
MTGQISRHPSSPHSSPQPRPQQDPFEVLTITPELHADYIQTLPSASFLQCPSWAQVKAGWESETIGWTDRTGTIVGSALVLYRTIRATGHRFAYLPEGPLIDWSDGDLSRWLDPLVSHLRERRAFAVRIGPAVDLHRWNAPTLKSALRHDEVLDLGDVAPDEVNDNGVAAAEQLRSLGWRSSGRLTRASVQPALIFELPLANRSLDDIWRGFNKQWRHSIRKAEREGVAVSLGDGQDLPAFYTLLKVTQERDGFDLGRSLGYYQRQYDALSAEHPERMALYLARHSGETLAAHTMNIVGDRAWYHLGASASHRRQLCPSHAVQWQMIRDAHRAGCATYDMRGFNTTLDTTDRRSGLLRWKVGTGGRAVELLGEWDYPLNRSLYHAFNLYLASRRLV